MLLNLRQRCRGRWVLALIFLSGALTVDAVAKEPATHNVSFDRWYAILLGDQHTGWAHIKVTRDPETDIITTVNETQFSLRRGNATVDVAIKTGFDENAQGRPIEARSQQKMSMMSINKVMHFRPQGIELVTRQGGHEQRQTLSSPQVPGGGNWLTPAAMDRYVQAQIERGAKSIRGWTLEPATGPQPIEIRMTRIGPEDVQVLGKVVPTTAWDIQTSAMPGVTSREYRDAQGRPIKSTINFLPGMSMTLVEADKQLATAKINPPELMASSLIHISRPLANPRQLRKAVYQLRFTPDGHPHTDRSHPSTQPPNHHRLANLPGSTHQHVSDADENSVRVEVDLDRPIAQPPPDSMEPYLAASTMLNRDDPQIQDLVTQALAKARLSHRSSASDRAEALRQWVHRYVQAKDLSVGYASASEVASTRQGDCTEHAVLLAAMLRAVEIPSRTVSGLIYVDRFLGKARVFGYHMWTQAWIAPKPGVDGQWVDLDATLPNQPFDAAHIALTTSAMADDAMINDMISLAPLFGRLQIKILEPE